MSCNEWKEANLGDFIALNYGKSLPKTKRVEGIYNVYGSSGITGTHNDYLVEGPGIIVGRKGTVGKVSYEEHNFFPIDTTYYITKSSEYNLKFMYYFLQTLSLDKMNSHSAVPGLNREEVYKLKVKIPNLQEQEKIANILSSLDDKIELNNEMNKTLEEMAQSIFKRWFVNFEFPNEDGEPYKSSGGEMVDSELGMIPKGWEVGTLDSIANITMGVSPKSSSYNAENIGIPLLNGAADFKGTIINPTKYTTEPKKICKKDDMVFCIRATIGNLTFTDREYCIGRGVASVTPIDKIYREFIYFNINTSIQSLIAKASGSVFLNLTKNNINKMQVIIPISNILEKFNKFAVNIIDKIQENNMANQNLAKLREELLSKLILDQI